MRRLFTLALVGLLVAVSSLAALEATGTIKKVDVDNGKIVVFANGKDRTLTLDKDIKVLGTDGKPLADGIKSKEIKEGAEVSITVDLNDNKAVLKTIQLGKAQAKGGPKKGDKGPKPAITGQASVGFKPLSEMTATDKYKGEDGGLYGGGKNEPQGAQAEGAKKETAKIEPLDQDGKPSKTGKIGLISISMSNGTMEYSVFKKMADADPEKSPFVAVVDCAQGGVTQERWANPKFQAWDVAMERLKKAEVSPKQVQVVWMKPANARPTGDLAEHGKKLQQDIVATLPLLKERFPNLRIVYCSSRIYAGYATTQLNPEPYAYEGAFPIRWVIQDQMKGNAELNYDPAKGAVKAPLVLWGPYLWSDGVKPRKSDGLVWEEKDLVESDRTHPSDSGRKKVAELISKFFKTDPFARTWYLKHPKQ